MTTTTPADELAAAARLIRDTAAAATPGPWHTVGLPWNHETPYVIAGHPDPHAGRFVADVEQVFGEDDDERDHGPDAAWIALASPLLAAPLADWLSSWVGVPFSEHGPMPDDLQYALRIARIVNGTGAP